MVEWNPVSWEDIGGLQDVKQAVKQVRKDTSQGCAFCTLSKYLKTRISQFHCIVTRKHEYKARILARCGRLALEKREASDSSVKRQIREPSESKVGYESKT